MFILLKCQLKRDLQTLGQESDSRDYQFISQECACWLNQSASAAYELLNAAPRQLNGGEKRVQKALKREL